MRGRLVPFPRCVRLLVKHVSTQMLQGARNIAGSSGTVPQARSQKGTTHGATAKRNDGLLPAVRAREYRRFFGAWFDITQSSKIVDIKITSTLSQQTATKLTSGTFFAWKLFVMVCSGCPRAFLGGVTLTLLTLTEWLAGVGQSGPICWADSAAVAAAELARRLRSLEEEEAAAKGAAVCRPPPSPFTHHRGAGTTLL